MRHAKKGTSWDGIPPHRKALLSNLSKRSSSTSGSRPARPGQAAKPEIEKLITLGKRGDLRPAPGPFGPAPDKFAVHKLFEEIAPATPSGTAATPGSSRSVPQSPIRPKWSSSNLSDLRSDGF